MEEVPVAAGRKVAGIELYLVRAGVSFLRGFAEGAAGDVEELELEGWLFEQRNKTSLLEMLIASQGIGNASVAHCDE